MASNYDGLACRWDESGLFLLEIMNVQRGVRHDKQTMTSQSFIN